jgi:hypothetical protein
MDVIPVNFAITSPLQRILDIDIVLREDFPMIPGLGQQNYISAIYP